MKFPTMALVALTLAYATYVQSFSMPRSHTRSSCLRMSYNNNPMDAYQRAMREVNNGFLTPDGFDYNGPGRVQQSRYGSVSPDVSPLLPDQDDRSQRTSSIFPRGAGANGVFGQPADMSLNDNRYQYRQTVQPQPVQQQKKRTSIFGQKAEVQQPRQYRQQPRQYRALPQGNSQYVPRISNSVNNDKDRWSKQIRRSSSNNNSNRRRVASERPMYSSAIPASDSTAERIQNRNQAIAQRNASLRAGTGRISSNANQNLNLEPANRNGNRNNYFGNNRVVNSIGQRPPPNNGVPKNSLNRKRFQTNVNAPPVNGRIRNPYVNTNNNNVILRPNNTLNVEGTYSTGSILGQPQPIGTLNTRNGQQQLYTNDTYMRQPQQYNDFTSRYSTPSSRRAEAAGFRIYEEPEYQTNNPSYDLYNDNGAAAAAALFIGVPLTLLIGPQYLENNPAIKEKLPPQVVEFSKNLQLPKSLKDINFGTNANGNFPSSGALREQIDKVSKQQSSTNINTAPKASPAVVTPPKPATPPPKQITQEQVLKELQSTTVTPKAPAPAPVPAAPKLTPEEILKQLDDIKVGYQAGDHAQQQHQEYWSGYSNSDDNMQQWANDQTQQQQQQHYMEGYSYNYEQQQQQQHVDQQYADGYEYNMATGDTTQQQWTADETQQQNAAGYNHDGTQYMGADGTQYVAAGDTTQQQWTADETQQRNAEEYNGHYWTGDNTQQRYLDNSYDDYSMF